MEDANGEECNSETKTQIQIVHLEVTKNLNPSTVEQSLWRWRGHPVGPSGVDVADKKLRAFSTGCAPHGKA